MYLTERNYNLAMTGKGEVSARPTPRIPEVAEQRMHTRLYTRASPSMTGSGISAQTLLRSLDQ